MGLYQVMLFEVEGFTVKQRSLQIKLVKSTSFRCSFLQCSSPGLKKKSFMKNAIRLTPLATAALRETHCN